MLKYFKSRFITILLFYFSFFFFVLLLTLLLLASFCFHFFCLIYYPLSFLSSKLHWAFSAVFYFPFTSELFRGLLFSIYIETLSTVFYLTVSLFSCQFSPRLTALFLLLHSSYICVLSEDFFLLATRKNCLFHTPMI